MFFKVMNTFLLSESFLTVAHSYIEGEMGSKQMKMENPPD